MRAVLIGVVGMSLSGVAAVVGTGGGAPNDYRAVVGRSPEAVYAAFAPLGAEGEQPVAVPGIPLQVTQRITKVPNQQVRLEILVEGDPLLTAEVHLASAGGGGSTQVSAEVDVNRAPIERVIVASGGEVPDGVLDHGRVDALFAEAMKDMMDDVEAGRPLTSVGGLLALRAQARSAAPAGRSATAQWRQEEEPRATLGAPPAAGPTPAPGAAESGWRPAPGGWGGR
jgi:hypothetical protein